MTVQIKRIERIPTLSKVCDIQVSKNHNFYIRTGMYSVLVHNCLLKSLEEPSAKSIWIICSMSPEKLITAIVGRCFRLDVKPIEPEVITKRLYRIAKREGTDMKNVDDGIDILKQIANFSNGQMRNSLQMLQSVLYAIDSGEKIDLKTALAKFVSTAEADLDKDAASVISAILKADYKGLISVCQCHENIRGILYKSRFLLDYLIAKSVNQAKFTPYSAHAFAKAYTDRVSLPKLLALQGLILDIEDRMNRMNVDERITFTSMAAQFMAQVEK